MRPSTQTATALPFKPRDAAWDEALQDCKKRLKREDWDRIAGIDTSEGLEIYLSDLQDKYQSRRSARFLRRCNCIVDNLRPFMQAVDQFSQADPAVACLVWGSIRTVLEVSPSRLISFEVQMTCLLTTSYKDCWTSGPNCGLCH